MSRGWRAASRQAADPRRDEVAVLADVLARDGAARSATETLRAELANADHLGVLARSIARVLDARVRRITGSRPPVLHGTWAGRSPSVGDPEIARYLGDLAEAMDDRTRRIGEPAVATEPAWAVLAIGPVPL